MCERYVNEHKQEDNSTFKLKMQGPRSRTIFPPKLRGGRLHKWHSLSRLPTRHTGSTGFSFLPTSTRYAIHRIMKLVCSIRMLLWSKDNAPYLLISRAFGVSRPPESGFCVGKVSNCRLLDPQLGQILICLDRGSNAQKPVWALFTSPCACLSPRTLKL